MTITVEQTNTEVIVEGQPLSDAFLKILWNLPGHVGSDARRPGRCTRKRLTQAEDFVQNTLSHFALGHFGKSEVSAITRENGYNVRIQIEARAFGSDIVRHDQIGVLGNEFLPGILRNMIRFGRETND